MWHHANPYRSVGKTSLEKGQILPLALVLLPVLIVFVGANGYRWHGGIQKIKYQRQADALVLLALNEQARAYNAIAALNEGLQITLERAYAMGVALVTLKACAALTLGTSPCLTALIRLESQAIPFFKKVNRLAKLLADQQDVLKSWAAKAPQKIVATYNIKNNINNHSTQKAILFTPAHLPIRRFTKHEIKSNGVEQSGFGNGSDLLRCNENKFSTYSSFHQARLTGSFYLKKHDTLTITYQSSNSGIPKLFHPKTSFEIRAFQRNRWINEHGQTQLFKFDTSVLRKCESFKDLLLRLNNYIPLPIQIPPPYVLDEKYFQDGNQMKIVLQSKDPENPFMPFLSQKGSSLKTSNKFWSVSQAKLKGHDLEKMDFSAHLSSFSGLKTFSDLWN